MKKKIWFKCQHCEKAAFYLRQVPVPGSKTNARIAYFDDPKKKAVSGQVMACQKCGKTLKFVGGALPLSSVMMGENPYPFTMRWMKPDAAAKNS